MVAMVTDNPILLVDGVSLFKDYAQFLRLFGAEKMTFHVGADTIERLVSDGNADLGILTEEGEDCPTFVAYNREGSDEVSVSFNSGEIMVTQVHRLPDELFAVSSTDARNTGKGVPEKVHNYMTRNSLYDQK
jgi:nicotinic acid mononucleotide adenylyltransferase